MPTAQNGSPRAGSPGSGSARTAGIRDVARMAGVSVASASFALNGQPGVADDTRRRILAITCTMVDHDTPLGPRMPGSMPVATIDDLAALHRELAANIPFGGEHPGRTGAVTDRNVELLISPPFPLGRLPGI